MNNYKNTLIENLGIEVLSVLESEITAKMPVDNRTCQPMGFLHGGASVALAETVASIGANNIAKKHNKIAVGLEINANHIKPINKGFVFAKATPFHIGKITQVWQVEISDESDCLISICRITIAVIDKCK